MFSKGYPVEALLRPPVELTVAAVSFMCALLMLLAPGTFMVTPDVAYWTAAMLAVYGLFWARRGWAVVRYQRNLRRRRKWVVGHEDIPVDSRGLFLGRGFRWTALHTQRLADTQKPRLRRWVEPGPMARWVRAHEYALQRLPLVGGIVAWDSPFNPLSPAPDVGGEPALHGVEMKERSVYLPLADRNGHTLVLGTTRVGKTRALELMAAQDIRRGDPVVVIDPKGDADLLRTVYDVCRESGRGHQFRLFHLGYPEISSRYNGIGDFRRITEVATRIAGQVEGEGQSAVFRQFVWRFVNVVARAVTAIGDRPNYETIHRYVLNIDELFTGYAREMYKGDADLMEEVKQSAEVVRRSNKPRDRRFEGRTYEAEAWERVFEDVNRGLERDDVLEGLRSAMRYERSYFDKLVASLLPLLEKLTSGKAAELLAPEYLDVDDLDSPRGDVRPVWGWSEVVNQRLVVYIGLDALSDSPVAQAVGNSMFADLVGYAGERYKHGDAYGLHADELEDEPAARIIVHMDEFSELMGDEFVPMVNKGGGAGLMITAYSQTLSDIEARTGSKAQAQQVVGNFNNLVMFRVKGLETAEILSEQLPEVTVTEMTHVAGYTDSSDPDSDMAFTSRQEDRVSTSRVRMLEAHALTRLPKGECFAMLRGGSEFVKLRLPMAKPSGRSAGEAFERLIADMRQSYESLGGTVVLEG